MVKALFLSRIDPLWGKPGVTEEYPATSPVGLILPAISIVVNVAPRAGACERRTQRAPAMVTVRQKLLPIRCVVILFLQPNLGLNWNPRRTAQQNGQTCTPPRVTLVWLSTVQSGSGDCPT